MATEFVGAGITMKSFFPSRTPGILAANPLSRYASGKDCGCALLELTPQQLALRLPRGGHWPPTSPASATAASFVVTPIGHRACSAGSSQASASPASRMGSRLASFIQTPPPVVTSAPAGERGQGSLVR